MIEVIVQVLVAAGTLILAVFAFWQIREQQRQRAAEVQSRTCERVYAKMLAELGGWAKAGTTTTKPTFESVSALTRDHSYLIGTIPEKLMKDFVDLEHTCQRIENLYKLLHPICDAEMARIVGAPISGLLSLELRIWIGGNWAGTASVLGLWARMVKPRQWAVNVTAGWGSANWNLNLIWRDTQVDDTEKSIGYVDALFAELESNSTAQAVRTETTSALHLGESIKERILDEYKQVVARRA